MQRNFYYRTFFKRRNAFKENFLNLFLSISSWPRLLLEVFIRRNFGERYFTFSGAIALAVMLSLYPILRSVGFHMFSSSYGGYREEFSLFKFLIHYLTWYAYLASFVYMVIKRNREIKHLPGVFNMARFSLSTGIIDQRFFDIRLGGKPVNIRTVETLLEPSLFFSIGFILWMVGQSLGLLLLACSIIYAMSYRAAYNLGDSFVLDKIDEMIANKQLVDAFVNGKDASETQGFRFYGHRPTDPDFRRELAETFVGQEETVEAV